LPEADALASLPTMSRLENRVSVKELLRIDYTLVDQFIASFNTAPEAIVMDLDPTSDTVHGNQQMALFKAFEDECYFMPVDLYDGLSGYFCEYTSWVGRYLSSFFQTLENPAFCAARSCFITRLPAMRLQCTTAGMN
jgi:hypothetical protein